MDVVIFAGGRGTRLMEKTHVIPKPMVEIGGMPIIWHIMKIYSHFGHKRFIITLGYKGEEIRKWFKDYIWLKHDIAFNMNDAYKKSPKIINGEPEDWEVVLVDTGLDSGTQKRLEKVRKYINGERFMVTYGDGVADININNLLDRHKKLVTSYNVLGTITTINLRTRFGIVHTDGDIVSGFEEKPLTKNLINIGFMVFEAEVLDRIKDSKEDSMLVTDLLPDLSKKKKLGFYHHKGFWECMDTYKDYIALNKLWVDSHPWRVWK